jgi:hypothetical protein
MRGKLLSAALFQPVEVPAQSAVAPTPAAQPPEAEIPLEEFAPEPPARSSRAFAPATHTPILGSSTSRVAAPALAARKSHFLKSAGLGLALAGLLYVPLLGASRTGGWGAPFADKFTSRGWTPYAAVFLTCWSICAMAGRALTVRRRGRYLDADYLPPGIDLASEEGIEEVLGKVHQTSKRLKDSILGRRVSRALAHFRISRNVKEVGDVLLEESDADFGEMDHAPPRVPLDDPHPRVHGASRAWATRWEASPRSWRLPRRWT